ncbi:ABC transporter substrate-binding protein [Motiliproteus sp. MSK22-1]|uniref:substrate-binding periplasmic protein n=1 Tax=Motiliproteus sp. MSK22-1 TaxID=1897630 RepID=UPI000978BFB1|nr:transporter substrate-binding domain-containing protein [Motiliproteus sp. MSK22-1]OMH29165.1 hypothetical protein BGP75_20705 [Motiliproteus sp. MSK22-1]
MIYTVSGCSHCTGYTIPFSSLFLILTFFIGNLSADDLTTSNNHITETTDIEVLATDFPPYELKEPVNGLEGFDVEVLKAAYQRVGIQARVLFVPWKRVVKSVELGEVAAMLSCVDAEKRRSFVAVSDPISALTPVLAVHTGYSGPPLHSLEDTRTLKGIGLRGYAFKDELSKLALPHIVLDSNEQALLFLIMGRADVFYTIKENAAYTSKKLGITDKIRYFELSDQHISPFHLCFSKHWPDYETLLELFNDGLKLIQLDGTYKAIHDRYR